jgi:calcineurin-like phosphoesterase
MPSRGTLNILALGDIIGKPGRVALAKNLDALIQECNADFVLANGENASGGLGITPQVAEELLSLSIDMLTSGNHIWKHREIRGFLDSQPRLLRPANYPDGSPGRGSGLYQAQNGMTIAVLNLEGLLFMNPLPCPFRTAEATSEKRALGHYLDGRVTAVVGTHTHIPTADAEVLPGGTGYLTDLGMCGPTDSVIGIRKEHAIARFTEKLPTNFQVAKGRVQIQGALIVADAKTGKCLEIVQRAWSV